MFEDSTFESAGRIRTRSRRWIMAALLLNGSILLGLVLIPLFYPEALPRAMMNILLEAPAPPPQQLHPVQQAVTRVSREAPEILDGHIFAPPKIPISIRMINTPEPPGGNTMPGMAELGGPGIPGAIFPCHSQPPRVRQAVTGPVRLPSSLVAGLLVSEVLPAYPQIAKAARRQGVIVLQATISKTGSIENLRVISGDPMLQQAALESVSHWRYRPYLLNGQPVEVETTVNVIFRLTE